MPASEAPQVPPDARTKLPSPARVGCSARAEPPVLVTVTTAFVSELPTRFAPKSKAVALREAEAGALVPPLPGVVLVAAWFEEPQPRAKTTRDSMGMESRVFINSLWVHGFVRLSVGNPAEQGKVAPQACIVCGRG